MTIAARRQVPQETVLAAADLHTWLDATVERECWFVQPAHHVPKVDDAVDIAILSQLPYRFGIIALGQYSLYHRVNRDPACPAIADRVCAYDPLLDESGRIRPLLRLAEPLPTLERRLHLARTRLVCVSLTNPDSVIASLELLRLGGVPLRREERAAQGGPLVLAGGPGCANPEPFAEYFDLFCVGDGGELTTRVASAIYDLRADTADLTAENVFETLDDRTGLYVPSLYRVSYAGVRIAGIEPIAGAPDHVEAAVDPVQAGATQSLVTDGETAVLVPNYGCKHRCSYCSISEIPYREYEVAPLLEAVDAYLDAGIRQLIINSATLTQHSAIIHLLEAIATKLENCPQAVTVYIGSMRFDELTSPVFDVMDRLGSFSHTYLKYTQGDDARYVAFAPEHGSREVLTRVTRPLDPWAMLEKVDQARQFGVDNFVLYFIVGFESETVEDRSQIGELIVAVADRIADRGGRIVAKINPIIPTPGTACQRLRMPSHDEYLAQVAEVGEVVRDGLGSERFDQQVEFALLPKDRLLLEAAINRADRRVAPLIEWTRAARASGEEPSALLLECWLEQLDLTWDDVSGSFGGETVMPWAVVDRTGKNAEQRVLMRVRNP